MIGKARPHHTLFCILSAGLLFLGLHSEVHAQATKYRFDRLGLEQGLPCLTVFAIAQDNRGFIWFGTFEGLCRYDGYAVKVYDHARFTPSSAILDDKQGSLWSTPEGQLHRLDLASGKTNRYNIGRVRVRGAFIDHQGDFWAGTDGGGLVRYKRSNDSVTIYTHQPGKAESLCNDTVWSIYEDSRKELWIITRSGLERFNRESESFYHIDSLRSSPIRDVVEGSDHTLRIGTDNGLCRLDPSSGVFSRYPVPSGQRSTGVQWLHEDRRGQVWVVSENYIGWINETTHRIELLRDPDLGTPLVPYGMYSGILEDREGALWFMIDRGLAFVDGRSKRCEIVVVDDLDPHGLPDVPLCLLEDNARNIWIGTFIRGVCMLDRNRMQFQHSGKLRPGDATFPCATSILEDSSGILWVGTVRGIFRLPATGKTRWYDLPGAVFAMLEVRAGVLWLGTDGGLYQFETATEKITRLPPPPEPSHGKPVSDSYTALMKDRSGRIWTGGGVANGLLGMVDLSTGASARYFVDDDSTLFGKPSYPIGAIHEDSYGTLWFTKRKISIFNRQSGQARCFESHADAASSFPIDGGPICESSDGTLWFGEGAWLTRFNKQDSTFSYVGVKQGLPDMRILELLEDNSGGREGKGKAGNLWLLTLNGITRYNPSTGAVNHYGPAYGVDIIPTDFIHSSYKNRKGYLFFGGTNGNVCFHPDSVRDNPVIPPVFITSFKIFNAEADLDSAVGEKKSIELSYRENVFSIEFAALNYDRPEKNQYAYRLEGFDRDWIYCGTRRSTMYTNLEPGTYVFRVKGSNNDGTWNEAGSSLRLVVLPPFWKTWWAYTLYVLFAVGLLYQAFRFQRRRLLLQQEVHVKDLEARKLKEIGEVKSRFFANISHEFRTPLTLILGPVGKWRERAQEEGLRNDLSMVERNAQRLLRLINQLLDLSKLEAGGMRLQVRSTDIAPLIKGIAYSFESAAEIRGITLKVVVCQEKIEGYCDRQVLEKVLTNLLANALKFTPTGGTVEVAVRLNRPTKEMAGTLASPSFQREGGRGDEFLVISVSDTGFGIPADMVDKIFDRFVQVDDSATRGQEGTGIGLALVKELIELHHGKISVTSKPGSGTTFTVSLPAGREHYQAEEITEGPYSEPIAEGPAAKTASVTMGAVQDPRPTRGEPDDTEIILIVEDNADVRQYVKDNLPSCYHVVEATDGVEGIETALATVPDLVISDVMMPRKDGYELCLTLKNDERTSHIPIILLTAKAATENKLEGLGTGADDYLIKPFEPKELQARVNNLIETRKKLRERFRTSLPLKPGEIAVTSMDDAFLRKVMAAVEQHMGQEHFYTDELAREVGLSRVQLHRKLTALTNQSPGEFVRYLRLHRAMELLEKHAGTVSEISYAVGFSDPSYFSKCFHKQFGKSPTDFKTAQF